MINQERTSIAIFGVITAMIVGTVMSSQLVFAIQSNGASVFAPGQLKGFESDSQSASAISPGSQEKAVPQHGRLPGGGCLAASISPGHLFKQEPTTTDINP